MTEKDTGIPGRGACHGRKKSHTDARGNFELKMLAAIRELNVELMVEPEVLNVDLPVIRPLM